MAEIGISIAAKVGENLVNPTIRQGQYLFCANKITKNLLQEKEKLTSEKDRIQRRADQAAKKTEIIDDGVKTWMDKVNNVLKEVEHLEREMEASKCCYQEWCPTWKRYRLCKQMVEKANIMTDFKNNSQFDPFSHLIPLPGIEYESSKDFIYFESTKRAYNQLFEALRDDSTCMIGLYGMGGSGKTALVTEVGKKAKELKLFDLVLLVTVSQTSDIRSIQGKMADMLSLRLGEESNEGRAQRLSLKLKEEKQVLIIVDDVWTKFNLKDIGIEFNENNKGSHKVLLTTRRQHVCSLMECERKISLGLLSEEEGWRLFKDFAAMDDQSSINMIERVAQEVAGECKGLPIAIKAVASSLKRKSNESQLHEWKVALQKLKASELIGIEEEDCEISVEDLIRYGVGLGVCGEFESFDLARSQVKAGLNKLLDSCLLMHSEKSEDYVKMHDLVRDTALWISSKDNKTIMVNTDKDLNSLLENEVTKNCFAVSSWYANTREISYQWDAPKLEILIFNGLSCVSFDGLKELKVLAITNKRRKWQSFLLPQSIQSLTILRTLCLRGWNLGDISFILSLRKLEVLDLQACYFREVPEGIENLNKLKLLDLRKSAVWGNYNSKAIARCPRLQELYVSGNRLDPPQCLVHDLASKNLQRYELLLGANKYAFDKDDSNIRILRIYDFDVSTIVGSKNHLLQNAKEVEFVYIYCGSDNVIPDMVRAVGGMNELRTLQLSLCEQIECLIETGSYQENSSLPKLVNLKLKHLHNLKELCRGRPIPGFFEKLEELYIINCRNLQNVFPRECKLCNIKILNLDGCGLVILFSVFVARSLQQLEELSIVDCQKLRHIITNEGGEISLTLNNSPAVLPKLKKLHVYYCHKLQFVFPISCGQQGLAQLQEIRIFGCDGLKYVFGPHELEHNNSSHDQNEIQIMLPSLQLFQLERLENLIGICPENCHASWPSLRELDWRNCPRLTTSPIYSQQHPNVSLK